MNKHFLSVSLNFFAVIFLISLIAAPFYFARSFSKVAGVKSEASFLISSQVDKFPGMKLAQEQNTFQISFTKLAESQAYLSVLIITNPTNSAKTYKINESSAENKAFFGEDVNNLQEEIKIPASASVGISLISTSSQNNQTAQFSISAE